MKEIAKVLTNALVEVYVQNSKYETESIIDGAITSAWYDSGNDNIVLYVQGQGKYNKNKKFFLKIITQFNIVPNKITSIHGYCGTGYAEILLKNQDTLALLNEIVYN